MKIHLLFFLLLLITTVSCSNNDLLPQKDAVRARIMYPSCGGTVIQFIEPTESVGKDWLWVKNLSDPFGGSNPSEVYPNCVTAFEIPKDRQVIGSTIEFTYNQTTKLPEPICAIGGLPSVYISITHINP